jgi:hypothetical protein
MKTIEETLVILEKVREKWSTAYNFLENVSGNNEDVPAAINKAQNRVLAECNSDLWRAIEEIKEIW